MKNKSKAAGFAAALTAVMVGVLCAQSTIHAEGGERNLAYRRAMYQSSSYNCNETAQLAADGIIGSDEDEKNMAYTFAHEHGNESRYGNVQYLFDRDTSTNWETYQKSAWVSVRLPRRSVVKSYSLASGQATWSNQLYAKGWTLEGSNDGSSWSAIDTRSNQGFAYNGESKIFEVPANTAAYTQYRLRMNAQTDRIYMSEWNLYDASGEAILAPYEENLFEFTSVWMSESNEEEWIYCDLGGDSEISRVKVHWGSAYASDYEIQISDDAQTWRTAAEKTHGAGGTEELVFDGAEQGRYVRLLCKTAADPDSVGFIVKEFEVFGTNDVFYTGEAGKQPELREDGSYLLSGGAWQVERASLVDEEADAAANPEMEGDAADETGARIASGDYDSSSWLPAVVPGTVLTSYKRAGAVPDPNYADQQTFLSDSYFKSNFWYRNEFEVPQEKEGEKVWLNFQSINWKAEVYLNGHRLGNIRGAFTRASFDATEYINYGGTNYLAVLIYKNTDPGTAYLSTDAHPGTMGGVFGNGGSIGRDAPTYAAAAGWDWVPTVRGRNIGIYNEVTLSFSGELQLVDPWMTTNFARSDDTPTNPIDPRWVGPDNIFNVKRSALDLTRAKLVLKTEVSNTSGEELTAVVTCTISERPELVFEKTVTVPANTTLPVELDPVWMEDPQVWWPNTYGEQPLYTAEVRVEAGGTVSDTNTFQFGVRELSYHLEKADNADRNGYYNGDKLGIYYNGVRIVVRGGNWGLEDADLDVDPERYDEKIRLQKENNFNMIRNWGGQTNDPEFYKACDRYGIIVWDDFFLPGCWLHHPSDFDMFLANAVDKVKNYRRHPSLALYCGANEMHPEKDDENNQNSPNTIEAGLRLIVEQHDGTRTYIPNSAQQPAAVDGPHQAKSPKFYFTNSVPRMMNSERGLPNIPVSETMRKTFPEDKLWPKNDLWALHDFAMQWNVNGADYMEALNNYGPYDSFEEFVSRAQMQGYELHKAMFEAVYAADTNGLLMWMSNPAWTSLMWQSYDYYHDGNGGYYGAKTANQPINYIWNPSDNSMVLHNTTPEDRRLTARVEVYDIDGKLLYSHGETRDMASDSRAELMKLGFPSGASPLKFIKTTVTDEAGETVGRDFYWHNTLEYGEYPNYQDYSDLAELEQAQVSAQYVHTGTDDDSEQYPYEHYKILLKNTGDTPALALRLKVMRQSDNERVLPVYYEDNYFSLMPGEVREVWAEFKQSSIEGDAPVFMIEGWNLEEQAFGPAEEAYVGKVSILREDGAGNKILSAGSYRGAVEIAAPEAGTSSAQVALALYRGNVMEQIVTAQAPANVGEGTATLLTEPMVLPEGDYTGCELRGFVWQEDMKPLNSRTTLKDRPMMGQTYINRNIAPEAVSVTASSESGGNLARYATDANPGTRWASDYTDDSWLEIDLGEERTLTSVVIQWQEAYASQYRVEISNDGETYTLLAREDNGDGGTDKFSFEPIRTRYVRWVGEKRATDWGYSMYELELNDNTQPNLALGAAVSVSSKEYSDTDPQKLTDGDLSSRWTSEWETPGMSESAKNNQWIVLDLGEEQTFRTIYMVWEAAFGKNYTIEVSSDGVNYDQVYSETNGKAGTNRYVLEEEATGRYVRFKLNQRGTGWGYSLYEIMIYQ